MKTMKQSRHSKSIFLSIATFSLAAFLFVNLHAGLTIPSQTVPGSALTQSKVEEPDNNAYDLPLPDVTVLGRLMELVDRLLPRSN